MIVICNLVGEIRELCLKILVARDAGSASPISPSWRRVRLRAMLENALATLKGEVEARKRRVVSSISSTTRKD